MSPDVTWLQLKRECAKCETTFGGSMLINLVFRSGGLCASIVDGPISRKLIGPQSASIAYEETPPTLSRPGAIPKIPK
jgi:hypothetical protein